MRVVCDSCGAVYRIADDKLVKEVNKATCKRCGHKIIIRKGGAAGAPPPEAGDGRTVVGPAPDYAASPPGDERTVITTIPELQRYETGAMAPIGSLTAELRTITEPSIPALRPQGPVDISPAASGTLPAAAPPPPTAPIAAPPSAAPMAPPASLAAMPSGPAPSPAPGFPPPAPLSPPPTLAAPESATAEGPLFDSGVFGDGGQVVIDDVAPAVSPVPPASLPLVVPPPPPLPSPAATPAPYGLAKNGGAGTPPVAATAAATAATTPAPAARPAPVAAPAAAPPRPAPRPVAPAAHGDFTVVQVLGVAVIAGVALGHLAPSLALAGTGLVLVGGFGAFLLPLMNGRGQKSGTALLTLVLAAGLAAAGTFALSQAGTAPAGDPLATASLAPAPAAAEPPAVDPPIPAPEPVPAEPAPPEPAAPATASDAPVAAVAAGGSGPTPPPTPAASTEPRSSGPTPAEIAAADREAEKRAAEARARREQEEAARKEKQRLEDEKRRQQEAAAATRLADASGSTSRPAPAAAKSEDKVSSGASGLKSPTEVLTATVINAIVGSNVSIRRCFYDARDRGLDVSGKIVLKFTVQPDGQVKNSRIQSAQYAGTDLEGCVTGEVNRLQFPPFDGPDQSIKFPFLVR